MGYFIVFVMAVIGLAIVAKYVSRTKILEDQVSLLQQQVTIMQRTLGELVRRLSDAPTQTDVSTGRVAQPTTPPSDSKRAPLAPDSRRRAAAAATPMSSSPIQAAEDPSFAKRTSRTQQELEALIGEKLLNRVGAIALILGVGFFLKYAFDRNWISPTVRILLGVALGSGLVVLASRQRDRLPIFAQGVLGAGLSILYLSAYATFGFYELVPRPIAFLMMAAVTALTLERGRRFDSIAVALLGWAGGFLTPALLSRGVETDPLGLFVYLVLLNVGILGLASLRRDWWVLEPLSLVATFVIFGGWYVGERTSSVKATIVFLCVIWALYHALDVWREVRDPSDNPMARSATATLNAVLFFSAMGALANDASGDWLKWVALVLAVAYAVPGVGIRRSISRHSLKSIVFLMTATGLQFDGFVRVELWAFEAFLFLALSIASRTPHLHAFALGAFAFTVASLFVVPGAIDRFPVVTGEAAFFNPRGFAFIAVAMVCGLGTLLYRLLRDGDPVEELEYGKPGLHYAWTFLIFVLLTVEILDLFDVRAGSANIVREENSYATGLILASVWIGYGLVLAFAGLRGKTQAIGHAGLISLIVGSVTTALFAVTYAPILQFRTIANLRFAVVMLTIASAYAVTLMLGQEEWHRKMAVALNIGIALLSFELLTAETRDHFQRQIAASGAGLSTSESGGLTLSLQNKQQLAISAAWLLYATVTMTIGIARRLRGFRIAAISLLLLTILKVFLYDLSFLTELYRIFSFVGLGVILLTASFAYQRYKTLIFGEEAPA